MVHALRESRRVLHRDGTLIDLRPLSTTFPIDAIVEGGAFRIGEGNATATIEDDRAADAAVLDAVRGGSLLPGQRTAFDIHYYWDTAAEMEDFLRTGRVPKTVTPSYAGIAAALGAASDRAGAPARVRCTRRMTLGSYRKARDG